ncbi:MAG: ABC transporter ATP-binding protein [Nocardioides sp.]|uniref:ABC transporter ATP-binding protein n=1 Tax=Nocardioides sp. TaxID=35761 RepID=UPI0039E391E3
MSGDESSLDLDGALPSAPFEQDVSPELLALSVNDLSVRFGVHCVLDGISLRVNLGESVAVVGRSGSGKSTLLSCILGLLRPESGSIEVCGEKVDPRRGRAMARLRRERIGVVFQSDELIPELSPIDNVVLAGLLGGLPRAQAHDRSVQLLKGLHVSPSEDRIVGLFSGGEQQRVAVARALVNHPSLLLADEPTASLDRETRDEVCALLRELPTSFECAMVLVSHDHVVAGSCDRIYRLENARLQALPAGGPK